MRKACWLVLLMGVGAVTTASLGQSLTQLQVARLDSLESKRLHEFSNVEIGDYIGLRQLRAGELQPQTLIKLYAEKALQQPYRLNSQRFDWSESDCVVFVERAVALSVSKDWQTFYRVAQRLEHKGGVVSVLERNYFPLADWIPNNAWLCSDVTALVGPTKEFSYTLNRRQFIEDIHFGELRQNPAGLAKKAAKDAKLANSPVAEQHTDKYLPKQALAQAASNLQTGDICFLIRTPTKSIPYIHCDHMGIIVKGEDGVVQLLHSARPRVRQENLAGILEVYQWNVGIKVVRLRENARALAAAELESAPIEVLSPSEVDTKVEYARNDRRTNYAN